VILPGWRSSVVVAALMLAAAGVAESQLPALGAGGLLHPQRRPVGVPTPPSCVDATFKGLDVSLKGWRCHASGARRGTIVYLHGVADNRASAVGVIQRFGYRGLDVVAYDSRAHGSSDGEVCTFGFFEKQDLRLVLNTLEPGPIVLLGTSLGAAVALQQAAEDRRVSGVVAAETFSDLRTVATERAPFFVTVGILKRAFAEVERLGAFRVDEVSPVLAAEKVVVPVLVIHGQADSDTLPDHSERVFAALKGPKRLMLVPGAAHNGSLRPEVWSEIETWVDDVIDRPEQPTNE
jgi:pimeloyl-ACP methyl ester carboxylesterase